MPRKKKKKYPRLPNGFGTIRNLGGNRTNPYGVYPPSTETDNRGNYIRPKAICYVDDWYVGFAVLNAYRAGTYKPGDEILFKQDRDKIADNALDDFCRRMLTDFTAHSHAVEIKKETEKTFAQVYEAFYEWKYGENAKKKLGQQSRNSTKAAFKNCEKLHNKIYRDITLDEMQDCLNNCPLKEASIELMINLLKQMGKFAEPRELCSKNYAQYLVMPDAERDEHGEPFTDEDLKILWSNKDNKTSEFILIMCYSGYRINAYKDIEINLEEKYFRGGLKTEAGKGRVVPIHSGIMPLVEKRLKRDGRLLKNDQDFRSDMYSFLKSVGIEKHTPHDCRHTFSKLCEDNEVKENDRKRMLGHKFSDITNKVYGHRDIEKLREEIEKIKIPEIN